MSDIIKEIEPNVLRYFMISVHYRNPINYNRELVDAARNGLMRIQDSYHQAAERLNKAVGTESDDKVLAKIDGNIKLLEAHMDDDFNTANAVAAWHELTGELNKYLRQPSTEKEVLEKFMAAFKTYSEILGVSLDRKELLLDEEVEALIEEREAARKNKDFARADEIRDSLKAEGIVLEDTKDGVRFKRG